MAKIKSPWDDNDDNELFDNQELQENDRTLGVAYNYLKNFDFSGGKIYENDKCVIRKGIINTTTKKEWKRNNKNTIRKK